MKIIRYGAAGSEKTAILHTDGTMRGIDGSADPFNRGTLDPSALDALKAIDPSTLLTVGEGERIGSCVPRPVNFIAVGLNYADHAAESGMPVPAEPILFSKTPNCIVGPDDDVIMPKGSIKLDWEIELAFVIGKRAHEVSEADAMSHVAGFCICNDVSERAWQIEGTGQWLKGKSAPTFGPLGPWLVTPDEIADVHDLKMELTVDGKVMQTGSTKTMVFQVPFLVSYISRFMELLPGDVVTTGTPPGVGMGMKPPVYLQVGQTMELKVDNLGSQRQRVVTA